METSIKKISPEVAKTLLQMNTSNRPLSESVVAKYANDMRRGSWKQNGDVIRISRSGIILDGQHRLSAIVKASRTLDMLVVEGLEDDVFDTIDTGKKRSASDVLGINGYSYAHTTAAAARILFIMDANKSGELYPELFRGSEYISNHDILNYVKEHPEVNVSAKVTEQYRFLKKLLSKSVTAALHCKFQEKDAELCTEFFEKLNTGIGLEQDSIILQLREKLLRELVETRKMGAHHRLILVIRAWNHLRKGEVSVRFTYKATDIIKKIL